jgi:hypothetical protein
MIQEFAIEVRDELASERIVKVINDGLGCVSKSTFNCLGRIVGRDHVIYCVGRGPGYRRQRADLKSPCNDYCYNLAKLDIHLGPLYAMLT